jgi:hypothetical protein
MDNLLPLVFVLVLLGVLAVLVLGIVSFALHGEFYRKNSNLMMRWRVGLQGLAVALLALIVWLASLGK